MSLTSASASAPPSTLVLKYLTGGGVEGKNEKPATTVATKTY